MGVSEEIFHDATRVAIVPKGFCYRGVTANSGDKPPMLICAPSWHPRLLPLRRHIQPTLLVGRCAICRCLGVGQVGPHVAAFKDAPAGYFPLPHHSWRSIGWERRNPWFGERLLPELRYQVARVLNL